MMATIHRKVIEELEHEVRELRGQVVTLCAHVMELRSEMRKTMKWKPAEPREPSKIVTWISNLFKKPTAVPAARALPPKDES